MVYLPGLVQLGSPALAKGASHAQLLPTPWTFCFLPRHQVKWSAFSQRQCKSVALIVLMYRSKLDHLFSLKEPFSSHRKNREKNHNKNIYPAINVVLLRPLTFLNRRVFQALFWLLIEICVTMKYWTISSRGLCLLIINVWLACLLMAGLKNHC